MLISLALALSVLQQAPLTPATPIVVPGGAGKFDFMNVDPTNRYVFACHPGKSSITVVNLASGGVKDVDAGVACNGMATDPSGKKAYAAGPGKQLVQIDMATWKKTGSLNLDGPGDSVIFDSSRGMVYVDNDDGTNLWAVDPQSMAIKQTITIKEAPEVMALDESAGRIYQNIKTSNSVQVIDLDKHTVVAEYSLGELTSPHGLALDKSANIVFSVGKNGKLVALDAANGKILYTADVVKGSDQIAYDAGLKRLYIPGSGKLQAYAVTADGAKLLGEASVPASCHSITVDPQTHDVWVAYADAKDSFVQKFSSGSR